MNELGFKINEVYAKTSEVREHFPEMVSVQV